MTGTAFLTAAYDGGMETVILLLLLASLDKNPSLQNSLRNFLGFYKENRELLTMLARTAQGEGAPQPVQPAAEQPAPKQNEAGTAKEKSRQETVGSLDLLDEYLKRCAV